VRRSRAGPIRCGRPARSWVRLLGPSHPCGDVAVLLASELVANSLRHGGSAGPGEAVTVTVTVVVWDDDVPGFGGSR
jgi:anti-sigma regulatory factor (Ser/Thr protein kinase)